MDTIRSIASPVVVAPRTMPSAPAETAPADSVSISAAPTRRAFWTEAARLGLLAGAPASGAPLAQLMPSAASALESLSADLAAAGLKLQKGRRPADLSSTFRDAPGGRPEEPLTVSGLGMKHAPVASLADLQALDAFHGEKDVDTLDHAPLARSLEHLASEEQKFYTGDSDRPFGRPVGIYGAYTGLLAGRDDLWMGPQKWHLADEAHAMETACFDFGGPATGLERADLADMIKTLDSEGYHFRRSYDEFNGTGAEMAPREVWRTFVDKPRSRVWVGVGNETIEKVRAEDLLSPDGLSDDIKDTVRFFELGLKPRVDRGELYEDNAGVEVGNFLDYLRKDLRRDAMDEADYKQIRERAVRLASLAGDIDVAKAADELVTFEVDGEALPARVDVMERLLRMENAAGKLKDDERTDDDEATEETPVPGRRAVEDYRLLLAHRLPGQTLAQAADTLEAFHAGIAVKKGWGPARDAFVFIQKGIRGGRLGADAIPAFLQAYLNTGSVDKAREALTAPAAAPGDVQRGATEVRVDGVRVPVRAT